MVALPAVLIDWVSMEVFEPVFVGPGGTDMHAAGGLQGPPYSTQGEISKILSDRSSEGSEPPASAHEPEPAAAENDEENDENETNDEDFLSFPGDEEPTGPGLTILDDGPPDPTPGAPCDDTPAGANATPAQVELLWLGAEAHFPGLQRKTAARLLYQLLTWSKTYEEARDFLFDRIDEVKEDPTIRAPLAWICHEPSFLAWREARNAPRAPKRPRAPARAPGGQGGPVTPHHGPPPLNAEEARAFQAELARRLPPPSEVVTRPGEPRATPLRWDAAQRATNATGARGVLASLAGPAPGPTLPPDHFGAGAVGTCVYKGFRYTRSSVEAAWTRVGRA